ncbi:MAG: ABC transporter ATP-binding protein [Promethearchaeota archaeon]
MSLKHLNVYQELEPKKDTRYKLFSPSFSRVFQFMKPYKKRFVATIVLSIIQALIFIVIPLMAGDALNVLDRVITSELGIARITDIANIDLSNYDLAAISRKAFISLLQILLLMLISILTVATIMYVRIYQNQRIGINIIFDLRNAIFRSLQSQSYSFYDNKHIGDLVARTTSDVNLLRQVMSEQLAFFIRSLLQFFLALMMMIYLNPFLSSIAFILMPISFFIVYKYRRKMHPIFLASRKSYGKLTSTVEENVNGIKIVQSFAQEENEIKNFHERNLDYFKKSMKVANLNAWFDPLIRLINTLGLIIVIFVGGYLYTKPNSEFQIGDVLTFILLLQFSLGPLRSIGVFLGNLSQINAACDRIVEVLDSTPEIKRPVDPIIKEIQGRVEFRNVSFKYPGSHQLVLKNINLVANPGDTIAILGATGSGKSCLINLIPRFYDIPEPDQELIDYGEILIDGINIKRYDLTCLRSQIGIVAQETFLFSRSIKSNIALARSDEKIRRLIDFFNKTRDDARALLEEPDLDARIISELEELIRKIDELKDFLDKDVEEAAKMASIHEFIISLPTRYETIVGERGVTLSGGQRQRIAIARALLTRPKILILDDATSSVDVDTEYEIQKNFKQLLSGKGSTTFIISQRLSTIRMADKIAVLKNGELVQFGTHNDLIREKDKIYYNIYSTLEQEAYTK